MSSQNGSRGTRWIAAIILTVTAIPIVSTWRLQRNMHTNPAAVSDAAQWVSPTQIEVQFHSGDGDGVLADISREVGASLQWNSPLHTETEIAVLTLPPDVSESKTLSILRSDGRVKAADAVHAYAEPSSAVLPQEFFAEEPDPTDSPPNQDDNRWRPNDPRYNEQWNFRMVHAEEAWGLSRGKGITVAVIDTGVAYADTRRGAIARDFKQTKFAKGYDFVHKDGTPYDDHGHGTHVAGTIAESTDNNEGVAGLAFDSTIMPVKVLSESGSGSSADIAEAIRYAADHGANVINMSLGSPFPDKLMAAACDYAHKKGVVIVCAAGNSGSEGVGFPAAYKDCIAVSSVGPKGDLAFYSSWGKEVAIAAPGGDSQVGGAAGTILQNTVMKDPQGNPIDDYYGFQGTSMAAPHVAAAAALIEAAGIRDPDDVKSILQKSAQPKSPARKYGAGILDAGQAVKLAVNTYQDGVARFWFVAALFAACYGIGRLRKKAGSSLGYPFWTTAAFAIGLLLPDWFIGRFGLGSHWNLLAQGILIPGILLVMMAEGTTERRLLGWMSLGLIFHLCWEFMRNTVPSGLEFHRLPMFPWIAANVLIGFGMFVAGMNAEKD